ncbi:DNA ligase [Hyalangium rubrum]|uniref:DNA ligase n=1 Tax=Hyalangium rubrum TaxID=3103134 RepID=A0ABU5GXM7_9BACT|nr:DNA ligase [Hyalangium sp. s54d21]MDY7225934.1 DNA ligase [Hyalangium sp. s54d21]
MADIANGEQLEVKGSGAKPYILKNTGGVYSCTCPAWRNQSVAIERRTCKHLRKIRGDAAEDARTQAAASGASASPSTNRARNRAAPASSASATSSDAKAPPVLLAHSWTNDTDLTGWWMSEKLDGVRAYWDGKRFLSRQGNPFYAPAWFTEKLPDYPLDGELFGGRKKFQRTVSVVRRQDQSDDWKELAFVIFDAPSLDAPFEERLAHCQQFVEDVAPPYAEWLEHQPCQSVKHLREELARVEGLGGEGLMLRQPGSRYEAGRSYTLLKVKSFHDDEARVIGHQPGAGRHKGRLGALEVELRNGTRFSVGTGLSDAERENPPGLGSIITFRYQELSNDGVPRFPSYVGVRIDAEPWKPTARGKRA